MTFASFGTPGRRSSRDSAGRQDGYFDLYSLFMRHESNEAATRRVAHLHSWQDIMATSKKKNTLAEKSGNTWSGRFDEPVSELVQRYTASVGFDRRLAEYDIQGSLAHARMLSDAGIIDADNLAAIEAGLSQIRGEIRSGEFVWRLELEDVHLNIEKRLTTLIGDAGKRLHTARSRNDQVATDVRLYLRASIDDIVRLIHAMQHALLDLAEQHADTVMPGFTHLQVAQPVVFGHHLMAYFEMLKRDAERLSDCRKRVNKLPLGAAALAGTSYPINREMVAQSTGVRRGLRKLAGCGFRPGFCHRVLRRRGADHDTSLAII